MGGAGVPYAVTVGTVGNGAGGGSGVAVFAGIFLTGVGSEVTGWSWVQPASDMATKATAAARLIR